MTAATSGSSWRAGLEWAHTRCGGTENGQKLWDCAYNNAIFNPDGYRYYGRPMGHAMDGDGQMYSSRYRACRRRGQHVDRRGALSKINEGGAVPDTRHSIAPGPEDWISLDVYLSSSVRAKGWIEGGVGVDHRDRQWNDTESTLPRVWLSGRRPCVDPRSATFSGGRQASQRCTGPQSSDTRRRPCASLPPSVYTSTTRRRYTIRT